MKRPLLPLLVAAAWATAASAQDDAQLCDTRAHGPLGTGSGDFMPAIDLVIPQAEFDEMNRTAEHGPRLEPLITVKYNGRTFHDVEIHVRGNLSVYNPKKSYLLKFGSGSRPTVSFYNDVTLPDMKRLVLNASWDDSSYVRNKLIFNLAQRAGSMAPATGFLNVCLNGRYHGFYQSIEKVDKAFLERRGIADAVIYKADEPRTWSNVGDPYASDLYPRGNLGFIDDSSDADDDAATIAQRKNDLKNFFINVNRDFSRINYRDYLNFHQVNSFLANGDTYDKNYYLVHQTNPDAWRIVFWDGDLSMGLKLKGELIDQKSEASMIHGQWHAGNPGLFVKRWYKAFKPGYLDEYERRLQGGGVFDAGRILQEAQMYRRYVERHAQRDLAKWMPQRRQQSQDFHGALPPWFGDVDFNRQSDYISQFLAGRRQTFMKIISDQRDNIDEF